MPTTIVFSHGLKLTVEEELEEVRAKLAADPWAQFNVAYRRNPVYVRAQEIAYMSTARLGTSPRRPR